MLGSEGNQGTSWDLSYPAGRALYLMGKQKAMARLRHCFWVRCLQGGTPWCQLGGWKFSLLFCVWLEQMISTFSLSRLPLSSSFGYR